MDKIEMSLDDIIKTNRGQRPRRGSGAGGRGQRRGVARQVPSVRGGSSGVLKGRNRGAIQKTNFSRVKIMEVAYVWKL